MDDPGNGTGDGGADRRIPVTVLGGFLGSGKTTLLRRLLRHPDFTDAAVLINEFGEAGLDHLLVGAVDAEPVLLSNGCLCCTIRGDLSAAIRDLHRRRQENGVFRFRRLVIETTGLADPAPVVATILSDRVIRHHFRAAPVLVAVDGQQGRAALRRHGVNRRQVAAADLLVVTKTDLADPGEVRTLRAELAALNPAATVREAANGALDPALLVAGAPHAPRGDAEPASGAAHGRARSFSLLVDRPIRWSAFGIWFSLMAHRHGDRLLRMKGILAVEDGDTPVAVHAVGPVVHPPEHLAAWPTADRRSRLVFIVEDLDPVLVERSFAAFSRLAAA